MILELEFEKSASPAACGLDSSDNRELSIFIRSLEVRSRGKTLEILDFSNADSLREHELFGFWDSEEGGVWCRGKRSALLLESDVAWPTCLDLILEAHCFHSAFPVCGFTLKTSKGHRGRGVVVGELKKVSVRLRKSLWRPARRLVVGNFRKMQSRANVSNQPQKPRVSLILVNLNKPRLTRLAAIAAASTGIRIPFEILVADNGSSPENLALLKAVEVPMRVLPLEQNMGFGSANNRAAAEARGDFLLFLNNDAFLKPGCLEGMLRAFDHRADCGAVGAVLRWPDGTLQEAGCLVRSDGHPIRPGRGEPNWDLKFLPEFHPVDYVSGACLLIRRHEFLEMGGFDPIYSPAYYEDTDLCMRLRERGKTIYLASRAECYHIENATSRDGSEENWATRQSEKNRLLFLERWGGLLQMRDKPRMGANGHE